ncbi:DJ-1/PfpI family protein [Streptomyces sp. NPDC007157]|uniref:DJ-1/PfpI family protein n=1 Tax=Streptomyces sp. NPDC007157 TaxID=3154681 RepID=UPI0033FBB152
MARADANRRRPRHRGAGRPERGRWRRHGHRCRQRRRAGSHGSPRRLRKAAATGARIASLCTGAFVLAQAGLLDGLRATTHRGLAGDLATRFPSIDVQPDLLFLEDGGIFTSAAAAAAIDLCLHLVRIDYGAAVANTAARLAAVLPVRPGGQSQFIETPLLLHHAPS